jgi:hypothetical protein
MAPAGADRTISAGRVALAGWPGLAGSTETARTGSPPARSVWPDHSILRD